MNLLRTDISSSRPGFALDVKQTFLSRGLSVLLGASGSGKTSLLRHIAGLETPSKGVISFNGTVWTDTKNRIFQKTSSRNIGMMFQDYALFDHMSVAENIGFGVGRNIRKNVVRHWLSLTGLEAYADRSVTALSGGQRQRVALARALAPVPDLLLLDEPFSALDHHLRVNLRTEIKSLLAKVGTPTLMVTHDLEEARTLGDEVGVMVEGCIRRFGATFDVFSDPGDFQVAKILGWRNLLPVCRTTEIDVEGPWGKLYTASEPPVTASWIGIRPEHIQLGDAGSNTLEANVAEIKELGAIREVTCLLKDGTLIVAHRPWNEPVPAPGETVKLFWPKNHLRMMGNGVVISNTKSVKSGQLQTPATGKDLNLVTPQEAS